MPDGKRQFGNCWFEYVVSRAGSSELILDIEAFSGSYSVATADYEPLCAVTVGHGRRGIDETYLEYRYTESKTFGVCVRGASAERVRIIGTPHALVSVLIGHGIRAVVDLRSEPRVMDTRLFGDFRICVDFEASKLAIYANNSVFVISSDGKAKVPREYFDSDIESAAFRADTLVLELDARHGETRRIIRDQDLTVAEF